MGLPFEPVDFFDFLDAPDRFPLGTAAGGHPGNFKPPALGTAPVELPAVASGGIASYGRYAPTTEEISRGEEAPMGGDSVSDGENSSHGAGHLFESIHQTGNISIISTGFSAAKPVDSPGGGGKKGGGGTDDGTGDSGDTGSDAGILASHTSIGATGNSRTDYNITVEFGIGEWTAEIQSAFIYAADWISSVILSDVSNERVPLFGRVDDLKIDARLVEIDGSGNILGGAAVFAYRTDTQLPAAAIMEFDVADVQTFLDLGQFDEIVLHEMLHCVGLGSMWDEMGLVSTIDNELRYTGELATFAYNYGDNSAIADTDPGSLNGVPVEMEGGQGTAGSHWDEVFFQEELMTGYLGTEPSGPADAERLVSDMTISALEDMGYDTIYDPSVLMIA